MSGDQLEEAKKFLQDYCSNHPEEINIEQPLPFRLLTRKTAKSDLRGECIDLCLQFLKPLSCPDILKFPLANHVTNKVISTDLSVHISEAVGETNETYYESTNIARLVQSSLHLTCKEWCSELPSNVCESNRTPCYSECGIRNTRRKMEDRHNVFTNLNSLLELKDCSHIQYYAVFDGHGGLEASCYAAKQLHLKLVQLENFTHDFAESLKTSIQQTDDEFCARAKNERLRSGTTAAVAVIYEEKLYLAWVGDSQAVLVKNGKPLEIMNPHKPERPDEKLRIEEMGGCVVWFGAWRVNGSLAVSRAIGDADHKPYVSGEADTATVPLDGREEFLCLACDGFWDVFTGTDLVNLVREYLKNPENDRSSIAQHLCSKAKSEGSTDNITVVLVFLRDDISLPEPEEKEETSQGSGDAQNGNDVKKDDVNSDAENPNNNNSNNNSNNNKSQSSPSGDSTNNPHGGAPADSLSMVIGQRVEPEPKARVPHKLLVNFVKKLHQREAEKNPAIVVSSSHHTRLPHSLNNPRWASPALSPKLARTDTKESLLSLNTISSTITELSPSPAKTKRSTSELPRIEDIDRVAGAPQRHSSVGNNPSFPQEKALGYRAVRRRGRPRVPYSPSLVSYQSVHDKSPRPLRKSAYSQSIPGDLNLSVENATEIAITNSLAMPAHKPLKDKRNPGNKKRSVVMLVRRGRQRSRSAF